MAEDVPSDQWCIDERHGVPCSQPCGACRDECSGEIVSFVRARFEFPELPDSWFVEMSQ